MKRFSVVILGALSCLAAVGLSAAPVSGEEPREDVITDSLVAGNGYQRLSLTHAVDVRTAGNLAEKFGTDLVGFRFDQPYLTGEFFAQSREEVEQFDTTFMAVNGTHPVVTDLLVDKSAPRNLQGEIQREAHSAPVAAEPPVPTRAIEAADELRRESESKRSEIAAKDSSARQLLTERWSPIDVVVNSASFASTQGANVVEMSALWAGGPQTLHDPTYLPEGWGIELTVTEHNDAVTPDLPGLFRPSCNPSDYRSQFWAARRALPYSYKSYAVYHENGLGSTVGAYLDFDDMFDDCSDQSVSVGIGYPRLLAQGAGGSGAVVTTQVFADVGIPSSTEFSSDIQAVPNNCGVDEPSTVCMGLDEDAELPDGMGRAVTVISKTRQYTLPGCYKSNIYSDDPFPVSCPW